MLDSKLLGIWERLYNMGSLNGPSPPAVAFGPPTLPVPIFFTWL